MEHIYLPRRFVERYRRIFEDWDDFVKTISTPLPVCIRINRIKNRSESLDMLDRFEPEKLIWYDLGYRLRNPKGIGRSIPFFLGMIMVQEEVSMIPPVIMDLEPGMRVLDMAAAPGSKTTQIADIMENSGLLIANDVSISRIRGLSANVERAGILNVVEVIMDGRLYGKLLPEYFDRVLLDAPCSAEGTIRKDRSIPYRWKEGLIRRMSHLQKALIVSAFRTLRSGGIMVYSTCTFAPEENEEVVDYLLQREDNAEVMDINLGLKTREGLTEWEGRTYSPEVKKCVRIAPQDNDTGGFFIAKIRKV